MRLEAVRYAAPEVRLYEFVPVDGVRLPPAEPGAHIGLKLPNGTERQYSLYTIAETDRCYRVAVKRDPASEGGSRYLHDVMRVGDVIDVVPPRNNFPLAESGGEAVFIAGGIGLTPILAMVERLEALRRPWSLHYAGRAREEAAFLDRLASWPQVKLHFDDEQGGVLPIASIAAAAAADAHLYCCGPAPMLAAFEAACAGRPDGHVHVEYFTQKHASSTEGGYTVQCAVAGIDIVVEPGQTILHAVQAAGIDVPSSCEEGVCGACETRVIAGVPDHRDALLSDSERAAGNTMFICCSGSKTPRLVLDL